MKNFNKLQVMFLSVVKKLNMVYLICFLIIVIFFLFFYDIGVNSTFFVKKDFTSAFLFRKTGNCDGFATYVEVDQYKWLEKCLEEKNNESSTLPIKKFKITEVTISGNKAYLQVELQRGKDAYYVNYQMIRSYGKWFINQPTQLQ